MKKEVINYLDVIFIKYSLQRKIKYSLASSFIISFLLMIMFDFHNNIGIARFFLLTSFFVCFFLIFMSISSKFVRPTVITKKIDKFNILKTIKFRLKQTHRPIAYAVIIVLSLYTLFLIIFTLFNYSLFKLYLIIILLFTTVIYYLLFFYNKFSYSITKKGIIIKGIRTPKLYRWDKMSNYKIKRTSLYIYFKNSKYFITLPYKKSVNSYLKKYIKNRKK